jgi:glycosyltransferase involved in cell wall biosynthesis
LLIEEGGLRSSFIIHVLKRLEKFVYNHSDAVTTIDQVFYNTISNRFKDVAKLRIIPNFVDTAIYKPEIVEHVPDIFSISDSLKLMYAGNIGHAQDWATLVSLASELRNDHVEFCIIGEGAMKQYLENEIKKNNLDKVHLLSYQPRHLMPSLIASADIQFIFMAPHTEGHGFPSKVYTIMACAMPIVVASGVNTPIINFLSDKECAMLVTEKEIDKKINEMVSILRNTDRDRLKEMGHNGYNQVCQSYSKEVVTSQYHELIKTMLQ